MNVTSNAKGQLAVTKAELRSLELGYVPSRPVFDTRYDLIIDKAGELEKIQVKYADGKPSASAGAVIVKLSYENRKRQVYTYQNQEVDGLVVYIPRIDKLCYFPQELFIGKRNLCIRLEKPLNNQMKGVIFATDYIW